MKLNLSILLAVSWIILACDDASDSTREVIEPQVQEEVSRYPDQVDKPDEINGRSDDARSSQPIRALYITNYTNLWHDYDAQKKLIMDGVSRYVSVEFDLVGKDPEDALTLLSAPEYGLGYDVIIYNMCFADDFNLERLNNIISQTRDFGVPAVLMHCAMHSFQQSSPRYPEQQLELRAAALDWEEKYPEIDFPYWWKFTGVDTLSHDWPRALTMMQGESDHPITRALPLEFPISNDELYQNLEVLEGVTPLYYAYSSQSKRDHLVAWTHTVGAGQVFSTTLGHGESTLEDRTFHKLLAHAIAYLTDHLDEAGQPEAAFAGTRRAENYQSTVVCHPAEMVEAVTVEQVQETVRRAYREGKSLKVISVPYSNSNSEFVCPEHGGILLNVYFLNSVLNVDHENLTVTVQPGIRATELSEFLHQEGLAIRAMPDYTGVSMAGGMATSAHHSSLRFPSGMADMVSSLVIVDGTGELVRFNEPYVAGAAVNLGMLGVVVEMTIKVEPQYKLQYGFTKGSDDELDGQIIDLVSSHDYARVMWFAGIGQYIVDYYDRVSTDTEGTSEHNVWTSTGSVFRFIGDLPYRALNRAPLEVQCESARLRYRLWSPPMNIKDSSRSEPVGWSHKMLGSTCSSGLCPWDHDRVRSRTMEATFPLSRIEEWMTDVRKIIKETRACFPILGIYLRFSKASDRWLAFNYGEDVVAVEIHVPKVADETYQERSADVYDEIIQMTLAKYRARPHWGKNSTPLFLGIGEAQYPRWESFRELKDELDPAGIFTNRIWRLLNQNEILKPYPGCVLARDCICSVDQDCGTNYRCETGASFSGARVCRPL